ncbi:hypothetical protein [Streptomyces sp. NPDC002265]|uniref:hypothetical protein n=1 Tax=Streptomyces sp. NPDC002265 TaxID=3154415 RepID=UPI0033329B76
MAISDRRKIAAALVLAAGGIGLVGVSSGATFTDTVTGSFTVKADIPPAPADPKLTIKCEDSSNWSTDNRDKTSVCTYKGKDIKFTGVTAKRLGVFTAQNTGDVDLKVTPSVTLPTALSGKVTAELKLVNGTSELKAKSKGDVDSATYEFWLTPKTSGDTVSEKDAQKITITFAYTAV